MEQILTNTCYEYTHFYAFPDMYNYDIILHEYLHTMYKCIHVHVYNIDIIHTCIYVYMYMYITLISYIHVYMY